VELRDLGDDDLDAVFEMMRTPEFHAYVDQASELLFGFGGAAADDH